MKIWLLNPPFLPKFSRPQRSPAVTKSGTLYYPIWLAYTAAVLEDDGQEVVLIDAPARNRTVADVVRQAEIDRPRLIVMDTSTPSILNDIGVAEALKRALPDCFIVLVGTHVSALPQETLGLSRHIDAVAVREYEYTIRDLARVLVGRSSGIPVDHAAITIQGLCLNTDQGIVCHSERPYINNLDELPWVSKIVERHLDIHDYFNPNAIYPMVTLITSRGCPFRCSFCVYPQTLTGRKYRFRSIDDVLDEMEYVIHAFPDVKSIFFEDDTLTANKKRCMQLADGIIRRNIRISWTANSRIDVNFETMQKIRAAGCRQLCVGFESGDQRILDAMKKGIQRDRMFQFMQDARRAGLLIHGCFMMGFPGDTPESIQRTIDLAIQLKPDTVQFYPVMVYPGTEAYREYSQKGWITVSDYSRWITPQGLHNCVIRNETLSSPELVRLCDQARRRFYLRPGYFLYKLIRILKNPEEIPRTVKAAATFFKHLLMGTQV